MRNTALRVERTVDGVEDEPRPPAPFDDLADLLRDERVVVEPLVQQRDHDALDLCVDRRRLVAALAQAHDRFTFDARRQVDEHALGVRDRRPARREPVGQSG